MAASYSQKARMQPMASSASRELYKCSAVISGKQLQGINYDYIRNLIETNKMETVVKQVTLSKHGSHVEFTFNTQEEMRRVCQTGIYDKSDARTLRFRPSIMNNRMFVKLNNVPYQLGEAEINAFLIQKGLTPVYWTWEKIVIRNSDIYIGEVAINCEITDKFTQLPPFFTLEHGRIIGIRHFGQKFDRNAPNRNTHREKTSAWDAQPRGNLPSNNPNGGVTFGKQQGINAVSDQTLYLHFTQFEVSGISDDQASALHEKVLNAEIMDSTVPDFVKWENRNGKYIFSIHDSLVKDFVNLMEAAKLDVIGFSGIGIQKIEYPKVSLFISGFTGNGMAARSYFNLTGSNADKIDITNFNFHAHKMDIVLIEPLFEAWGDALKKGVNSGPAGCIKGYREVKDRDNWDNIVGVEAGEGMEVDKTGIGGAAPGGDPDKPGMSVSISVTDPDNNILNLEDDVKVEVPLQSDGGAERNPQLTEAVTQIAVNDESDIMFSAESNSLNASIQIEPTESNVITTNETLSIEQTGSTDRADAVAAGNPNNDISIIKTVEVKSTDDVVVIDEKVGPDDVPVASQTREVIVSDDTALDVSLVSPEVVTEIVTPKTARDCASEIQETFEDDIAHSTDILLINDVVNVVPTHIGMGDSAPMDIDNVSGVQDVYDPLQASQLVIAVETDNNSVSEGDKSNLLLKICTPPQRVVAAADVKWTSGTLVRRNSLSDALLGGMVADYKSEPPDGGGSITSEDADVPMGEDGTPEQPTGLSEAELMEFHKKSLRSRQATNGKPFYKKSCRGKSVERPIQEHRIKKAHTANKGKAKKAKDTASFTAGAKNQIKTEAKQP